MQGCGVSPWGQPVSSGQHINDDPHKEKWYSLLQHLSTANRFPAGGGTSGFPPNFQVGIFNWLVDLILLLCRQSQLLWVLLYNSHRCPEDSISQDSFPTSGSYIPMSSLMFPESCGGGIEITHLWLITYSQYFKPLWVSALARISFFRSRVQRKLSK